MTESFPRLAARTARFTLGIPRAITVAADGTKVWFIRTPDGLTRAGQLLEFDVLTGAETVLVDPRTLLDADEDLPAAERARRERARESGAGIVDFTVDDTGRWAVFALSGHACGVHLGAHAVRCLPTVPGVIDPRVDPTGRQVAYVSESSLRVIDIAGGDDRALAEPETPTQVWGRAEFIAAEELDRHRGFWWAPDGRSLLAERYDEADVAIWHVADASSPEAPAVQQRYPAAGTANAEVTLWHLGLDGSRCEIQWDRQAFEYLTSVTWTPHGAPLLQVLSRDQRRAQILAADVTTGATRVVRELADESWVEVTSAPRYADGGHVVTIEDGGAGKRRVVVDGEPVSDPTWQVRHIVSTHADCVIATASLEPTEVQIVRFGLDGTCEPMTSGVAVHNAWVGGSTVVIARSALADAETSFVVHGGQRNTARPIQVVSHPAPFRPSVHVLRAGPHDLRTAVLFPRNHQQGGASRLPILLNPYGGPHAQRVLASARMFLEPQWFADQGFCVVVADGRGTPGRDAAWERSVLHDLATPVLEDQIAALDHVIDRYPDDVDPSRVGITGWSFGGYLAALAVLRRPDRFHAAVAGAPVTEWRLYDTAYTERYLGDPRHEPERYDANSLLPLAAHLERPLLLVHGLADDNVFAAHTLQLSAALLAAGRPHSVLPLTGVTHMASSEDVAENLALLQLDFLQKALAT
ncbi:MAG TPA: prolyl oligopeptidase family serine peptidase [Aeromicrobium sp.]|nr:prolyl oligopeptidase family serine peptidase [Aeromicrobium sp.]